MKKSIFCLAIFCFILFSVAARSSAQKSKNTVEIFTDVANIPESEQNWLGVSVADKLEANLFAYTDLSFINSFNKKQILQIQRESEGAEYNESAAIEVGNLTPAYNAIFINIKKGGTKYTVTIRYTDLETGENLAIVNGTGDSAESLYANNGCIIDQLTIDLCEALNIILTPTEKHMIMNGARDLTSSEKSKLYDEQIERYKAQIEDLDKSIEAISISDSIDADLYLNQLEIKKKLADENLAVAKANQRRAEEEAKKQKEEEARNAKRSAEQRDTINKMSQELKEKYSELRTKKLSDEPILGKIKVIELKKKALVEIQAEIDAEIEKLNNQAKDDIERKYNEIYNREISVVEQGKSANVLSENAKINRTREFENEKEKILRDLKLDTNQINDKLLKENKKLLNEIHKDYNKLKNITVSSLSDDLEVLYGNYDGNKGGWTLYVSVKSDNVNIHNTTSFLSYKELTGKDPIKDSRDPNYKDFAADVDIFESLFMRNEPILTYEVEYTVLPYEPEFPSKYRFKYSYLKYYDTRNMSVWGNKLRATKTGFLPLDSDTVSHQLEPVYDIRKIEENETASIKIDNIAYDFEHEQEKNEARLREEELQRLEKQRKEELKAETEQESNSTFEFRDHSLIGVNAGFGLAGIKGPCVEMEMDFALADCIYWGLTATSFFPTKAVGYDVIPDVSFLMVDQVKLGVNMDLIFINFYGSVGCGINYFTYVSDWAKNKVDLPKNIPNDIRFSYTIEVGGNIQLSDYFAISCSYMMIFFDKGKNEFSNLDFGIALTF